VHDAEKLSLDQIEAFLNASEEIRCGSSKLCTSAISMTWELARWEMFR
jgi:hypothetical protein